MALTAFVYKELHSSSLSAHHHSQLARSLERILEEAQGSGELILTNRKLKDFPKTGTKYNLSDTIIADLSRNRFCELPEEVTTFSFLETLLLYHNGIRNIPESVKHLTSLTYLDLRSNQLSSLPREVCFLPLQVLLVSNNRLTSLPDELGRMDRLTDLDASYNQLTALPTRIGELRSLRSFSLRSNHLIFLPRELTCLTLVSLDISNNRIASLPLEIRQMSTLVEFHLENNPLISPPASLCIRGLVHVFKFLETQATKDEKGSRAGGNYDGYTTLRRTTRHNSNIESNRVPRHNPDSPFSTCDGIDKRWSHDTMPIVKTKHDSPRRTPTTPPSSLSSELMDASLTSSSSTIVDESLTITTAMRKSLQAELQLDDSPTKGLDDNQYMNTLHQHINYAHSSSSNGSSPDHEDLMIDHHQQQHNQNGRLDEKNNKNLGNIQTYKEYKEALKQQRNQETSSVYKIKNHKTLYDMSEAANTFNCNKQSPSPSDDIESRFVNGSATGNVPMPKSIMKNGTKGNSFKGLNGTPNGILLNGVDDVVIPKKPIQKVIPSRNTELMKMQGGGDADKLLSQSNGDCLGYVKPNSPMITPNGAVGGGILTNNNKLNTNGGIKSPVSSTTKLGTPKNHRTVTWNHDIPPEKLSFTMRREFDRQREETELMTQLRSIIETRLKMTLPEDIASALTDGVILCHLANYVRPRSVASIHVPSPGVSKLTMARCRRNVDNFLDACRRIGVDEELICSCADVVPSSDNSDSNNSNNFVYGLGNFTTSCNNNNEQQQQLVGEEDDPLKILPNPSAVLKTISALIAMDSNPYHQNIKNIQQQRILQKNLKKHDEHEHPELIKFHKEPQNRQEFHLDYQNHWFESERETRAEIEQEQLSTATCTKEQMRNDEIIADMTINSNANNHLKKSIANGNEHVVCTLVGEHENVDNGNHSDECELVENVSLMDNFHKQRQQKQSSHGNVVGTLLRHAKMKSFQKIQMNFLSSQSHNNYNGDQQNELTLGLTGLHTIAETENDVGGSGNCGSNNLYSTSGVYQLINERSSMNEELSLNLSTALKEVDGDTSYKPNKTKNYCNNKTGIVENESEQGVASSVTVVSKRIEFFENSNSVCQTTQVPINKPIALLSNNAGDKTTDDAVALLQSDLKPIKSNNIFSIYRVTGINDPKISKDSQPKLQKEAGSSIFLRHDSQTLTIILSCVFVVTFLLLAFFPIPG